MPVKIPYSPWCTIHGYFNFFRSIMRRTSSYTLPTVTRVCMEHRDPWTTQLFKKLWTKRNNFWHRTILDINEKYNSRKWKFCWPSRIVNLNCNFWTIYLKTFFFVSVVNLLWYFFNWINSLLYLEAVSSDPLSLDFNTHIVRLYTKLTATNAPSHHDLDSRTKRFVSVHI